MCDHTFLNRPDGMPCVRDEMRPGEPEHTVGAGCIFRGTPGGARVEGATT